MKNSFTYKFADHLPQIDSNVNKYTRGRAVLLAGSSEYPGAAILCSKAAARSGCGYVEVFAASDAIKAIQISNPSIVVRDIQNFSQFVGSKKAGAYLIGPGVIPTKEHRDALISILNKDDACVVVDAEMINALNDSEVINAAKQRKNAIVITPHTGEIKKWIGTTSQNLNGANADEIEQMVKQKIENDNLENIIVVAKGPKTIIVTKNQTYYPTCGTYSLATAGSGDVLAGIIAGILSQKHICSLDEIAKTCALCVEIHALSGNLCADIFGKRSVMAQDLSDFIGKAIEEIES